MFSKDRLEFGILAIIASFGNVWADQSYWQVGAKSSIFCTAVREVFFILYTDNSAHRILLSLNYSSMNMRIKRIS